LQAAYTPLGSSALLKNPQHRLEVIRPVVERIGGSILHGWFTFGDHDVLVICELPDDVTAAVLAMAIAAGGAIKSVKTTPLMTFEDGGFRPCKKPRRPNMRQRPARFPTSASVGKAAEGCRVEGERYDGYSAR
jgi:uncharacterized protein with GYD domain